MIRVSLHNMRSKTTMSSDREYYISIYVYWLKLNIDEEWRFERSHVNGEVHSIEFYREEDATAFKLKFGL